jgi:protein-S-isoprenylcysteine O-methyltransferase Ste14
MSTVPRLVRKRLKPRLLVVYALALAIFWFARPTLWTLAIGFVLVAGGELLRIWATGHLHKTEQLTVTGAYAYLRHPLYTGTLLIATGFAVMAAHPLAVGTYMLFLLGFFLYYMPYKNLIEGARLESLYGDEYRRYASAVPPLLPRIHPYIPLGADPNATAGWEPLRFEDNSELGTAVGVGLGAALMVLRHLLG